MKTKQKRLVGIMPYGPGDKTVPGVTLVYVHTEKVSNEEVSVVSYKTLTEDVVKQWLPKTLNREAVAFGFSVALKAALYPVNELVRIAALVRHEM